MKELQTPKCGSVFSDTQYNIIGDIHGRTGWKELVRDDSVNIFVGDYFDPYEPLSSLHLIHNFVDILSFAAQHPDTVLLYGNHDLHYLFGGDRSSRYDASNAATYGRLFAETKSMFRGVAYAIGDSALVTHAGVTRPWYEKHIGSYQGEPVAAVADKINALWNTDKQSFAFDTSNPYDCYGESPVQSPLWIRPWTLVEHNLFAATAYAQIFGHTQMSDLSLVDTKLICVDCLGSVTRSFTTK